VGRRDRRRRPGADPSQAGRPEGGRVLLLTEVEAGARSYNEWHLLDHLPNSSCWPASPGVALGAPAEPPARASSPLDRTQYVTLYLLAGPLGDALADFREHGVALARAGRFRKQRTSHLAGPLLVGAQCAASRRRGPGSGALPAGDRCPPARAARRPRPRDGLRRRIDVPGVARCGRSPACHPAQPAFGGGSRKAEVMRVARR
jgi:hypothetical protein